MTRTKAAISHLVLSIIIFCGVIAALLFLWYPPPYFTASGGWQGLKIAASVDLVLGPLLTFVVFDLDKKSRQKLIGDLTIIALMQFTALSWGIYTIYSQRPVAVVFWEHEFMTVPAKAIKEQGLELDELDRFGKQKPPLIYAEKPKELEQLKAMAERIRDTGVPPHWDLLLYKPLADFFDEILPFQLNMDDIVAHNSEVKAELEKILAETGKQQNDYFYFSLRSKYHNIILLFSHDGKLENHIVVKLD
jgi:ElaB/YqjD/DUF883 family membrane-anchored ribosome-binding protein